VRGSLLHFAANERTMTAAIFATVSTLQMKRSRENGPAFGIDVRVHALALQSSLGANTSEDQISSIRLFSIMSEQMQTVLAET
jgi:hypothetical protein